MLILCLSYSVYLHTGWHKNGTLFLYALTLSNIKGFSKLFYCQNQETIYNNEIMKHPTTSKVCCYTIL